jgi:hypothetical protein
MRNTAQIVAERHDDPEAYTLKVRFTSTGKTLELAVIEPLEDGFLGQALGRDRSREIVRYDALDYVRILEAGER